MNNSFGFAALGAVILAATALTGSTACSDTTVETGGNTTTTTTTSTTSTTHTGGGGTGGTAGTGGTGAIGGGGSGPTGTDTCPGDPYTLTLGEHLVLDGDTSTAAGDYSAFCGGTSMDLVYAFTVTQAGTFHIVLDTTGSSLDPVLYMRSTCADAVSTIWCRNQGGVQETFLMNLDPGTYYVFVDGDGQTQGSYTLTVDFTAPLCGDGALNPPEECDDGNHDNGDGCDSTCHLEAHAYESCTSPSPGEIIPAGHTLIAGSDYGNADDHTWPNGVCDIDDAGGGPDQVYVLLPQISGTMLLRVGYDAADQVSECSIDPNGNYCWDRMIYMRHLTGQSGSGVCANIANHMACAGPSAAPDFANDLTVQVTAGETYYFFIDSFWDGGGNAGLVSGPYYLHIYLNP